MNSTPRRAALAALASLALPLLPSASAQRGGGDRPEVRASELVVASRTLQSPRPAAGALFGYALCWLDFDGDGEQDLAVGAPGEDAVYVFRGPDLEHARRFAPEGEVGTRFGTAVAAGALDDEPGDELVVGATSAAAGALEGAGAVWVISRAALEPHRLELPASEKAALGNSVAVGDLDGDGTADVAAGAPKHRVGGEPAGAVVVLGSAAGEALVIENPIGAWKHGNFGHDLACGDADGDGRDELFVSALGNRSAAGVRGAGQVYVLFDALGEHRALAVEDPDAQEGDGARFGMSIGAGDVDGDGDVDLVVGAPRKNGGGVEDAGLGMVFLAPEFGARDARTYLRPGAQPHDVLGFRARVADLVGGPEPDVVLGTLSRETGCSLVVWDGGDAAAEAIELGSPAGGSSHPIQGLAARPTRDEGQRPPLVLGDPQFGAPRAADTGRVVVWGTRP